MNNQENIVCYLVRDNKNYYLLKENGELTRNVDEALVRTKNTNDTTFMALEEVRKEYPNLKIIDYLPTYTAQDYLDENYPLKRKSISKKEREIVYRKYNGHCAYCGCKLEFKEMQVDHILSHKYNKGTDDIKNYNPACRDCNQFKMCSDIENFRFRITDTIRVCSKRNSNYLWDRIYKKYGLDKDKNKKIKFYYEEGKQNE